jgi:hypothetical protein
MAREARERVMMSAMPIHLRRTGPQSAPVGRAAVRVASLLIVLATAACDVRVGDEGVSVGVSAGRAEDEWTRSYELAPSGQLEIVSFNGPVELRPSAGSHVDVRIVREARGASDEAAREALERVEIVEEAGPSRVSIHVRPAEDGAGDRRARRQGQTIRVEAQVPAGLMLSVSTQNGPVHVENVTGQLTAATSNGPLRVTGLSGGVSAAVVNGAVELDFASLDAPSELTVVNGAIRIALPSDVRTTLSGTITNGRLILDDSFTLAGAPESAFAGQQRLGGSINGGGPALAIQATNGSVRIVPRTAAPDTARGR